MEDVISMVSLNFYNESNFNNYLSELANWHTCENSILYIDKEQLKDSAKGCDEIIVCRFYGEICELKNQLSHIKLYSLFPKINEKVSIIIQYNAQISLMDIVEATSIIADMTVCKEVYSVGFTDMHGKCNELGIEIVIPIKSYLKPFKA